MELEINKPSKIKANTVSLLVSFLSKLLCPPISTFPHLTLAPISVCLYWLHLWAADRPFTVSLTASPTLAHRWF